MITTLLLVVLAVLAYRRGIAGYPPPPAGLGLLHRGEAAFIESVAEALFPSGSGLAVSGLEAQLPASIDRHLSALPRSQRWQIRALFAAVEHVTLLVPGDEPGGRGRFSSLTVASRVAVLDRLQHHPRSFLRLLFTALRSVFVLGYLGHPANLNGLGLAPFAIDPVVSDAELLFPRIGALVSSIPYGREDGREDGPEDGPDDTPLARTADAERPPLDPHGPRHPAYARRTGAARRVGRVS